MTVNARNPIEELLKEDPFLRDWHETFHLEQAVPAKTILLNAGTVSKNFYYIKKGSLRLWFNQEGKDVTVQFFFSGHGVASLESFLQNSPSVFSIETIEPTTLWVYPKAAVVQLMEQNPSLKDKLNKLLLERLINYTHLFLSRIKDSPQQRYENLLKEFPELLETVPQHYIASYLGITPVSLSRIKNRK